MKLPKTLAAAITALAIGLTSVGMSVASSPAADAATACTSQIFNTSSTAKDCAKYIQTLANAIDKKNSSFLGPYVALVVDGKYGAKTKAAITNIQAHSWIQPANGGAVKALSTDGITGPDTWMILCVYGMLANGADDVAYQAYKAAGCSAYVPSRQSVGGWVLAASKPGPLKPPPPPSLKATLSATSVNAHAQRVSVNVTSCPGAVTLTYPWWAVPVDVSGTTKSATSSCSGSTTISLQVLTNTGASRSGSITVTSGGQKVTLTLTQAAATTKLSYVALGDSVSAGTGTSMPDATGKNPDWRRTANYDLPDVYMRTNFNTVILAPPSKRNANAWPVLLANQANLALTDFRASTGAHAFDVNNKPLESRKADPINDSQYGRVSTSQLANPINPAAVDVVTITVGGNDAGFVKFVTSCVWGSCDPAMTKPDVIAGRLANLPSAYTAILNTYPNATVYVVGYAQSSPPTETSPCGPTDIGPNGREYVDSNGVPHINWAQDQNWPRVTAMTTNVNNQVKAAVTSLNNPRLRFVNISRDDYPGYFCRPASSGGAMFVTNIVASAAGNAFDGYPDGPQNNEAAGHPNLDGAKAYANAVQRALTSTTGNYG